MIVRMTAVAILTLLCTEVGAAQTLPAGRRTAVSATERAAIPSRSIIRIEADIASRIDGWSGVRSCSTTGRARRARTIAFNAWIGREVRNRPAMRYIGGGWSDGRWWYRNSRRSNGSRYCRGGFTRQPAFLEFARS